MDWIHYDGMKKEFGVVNCLYEIEKNIIPKACDLVEVLKRLDFLKIKVLFVVDDDNRIVASVTDGDIRRAILKGNSLDSEVLKIGNLNPTVVHTEDVEKIDFLLSKEMLGAVPLVDDAGHIIKIFCSGSGQEKEGKKVNVPVVIMAGGQGKRLYPYTKILPKPLIPIEDTPICERIINSFVNIGCEKFYMIVNYKKNMIKSYFIDANLECNLEFIDEDIPLGTGGGLKLCSEQIKDTFILTNCDILILEDTSKIVEHHYENGNDVTMVCSLKNFEIPYGVVNFSEGGEISSFEEKPKMSFFTNTGYYVVEPEVMNYIGENENIGMPDIIERMKADGKKIGIYPIGEDAWLDMGQFDSMEGMERRLREMSSR